MPRVVAAPIVLLLMAVALARGEEPGTNDSWEAAAQSLLRATVTVRIWGESPAASPARPAAVTVCSGICVAEGRIITAALVGSDTRIRLTLPGGKQAGAKVQVIDEYSGLALLRTEAELATVPVAAGLPAVGGELLTAAAWGIEQPIVSRGIVGGVDRKRSGSSYPPLLHADVLTEETSSGAGLVDRGGKLVGVIVAADREAGRRGWAYAVPASHVERILRAADEQQAGSVLVLKRRRPVVGMVLQQADEAIVVERVAPGGPAETAGIKPGDQVLTTDGVAIRSVYQAVLPTLFKQPGDTTTFQIARPGVGMQDVKVVLGGGVELSSAPFDLLADLVQPKVRLAIDRDGAIVASRRASKLREVFAPPLPDDEPPPAAPTAAEQIALLQKALDRYQAVIELQQRQLTDEQKRRGEQEELIQSLRSEMESLRKAVVAEKEK